MRILVDSAQMTRSYPSSPREMRSRKFPSRPAKPAPATDTWQHKKNGMNCMSAGSEQAMPSCRNTHNECKFECMISNTSMQTQGTQQQLRWSVQLKKQGCHIQKRTCARTSNVDQLTRRNVLDKFAGIIILQNTCRLQLELAKNKAIMKWNYHDRVLRFIKHPWQMDIQKLRTAGINKRCGYYSQKYIKDSFSHCQNIIERINEMNTSYQDLCEVPTFQHRIHIINASSTNVSRTVLLCVLLALAALAPENSGVSPSHTIRVLPATLTMSKFLYQENILMYIERAFCIDPDCPKQYVYPFKHTPQTWTCPIHIRKRRGRLWKNWLTTCSKWASYHVRLSQNEAKQPRHSHSPVLK